MINLAELKRLANANELAVAIAEDGSLGTDILELLEEAQDLAIAIDWLIPKGDPLAIKARAFLAKLGEEKG